ncbi:hypothetical protein ABLE91_06780 [Aquabacter sp. CN5-332]|uniref:hypothetical protein n=1 Tax=Aquabacter sp. CN5-332 TaxID=3156608 RepID=UPI0032B46723
MSGPRPPRLPDLASLTEAQKDELIVSLWETLVALDGGAPAAPPNPAAAAPPESLSARIRTTAPSRRGRTSSPAAPALGRGFSFLEWRPLQWLVILVGLSFLLDFGVGFYQQRALARQDQATLALRSAAFEGLYVELVRVAYEPDGKSYRATLSMQNVNPDRPLYVMLNPARAFVQTGLSWQEVPSQAPPGAPWGVVKLEGSHTYSVLFQVDASDWSQLIPGYMHVLIQSDMLISQSSAPKEDIVERNNRFYVYLKPQGADDAWIKSRNTFPGIPPVFIPMPPH